MTLLVSRCNPEHFLNASRRFSFHCHKSLVTVSPVALCLSGGSLLSAARLNSPIGYRRRSDQAWISCGPLLFVAQKLLFLRLIFKDELRCERQKSLRPFNLCLAQTRVAPCKTAGRMELQLGGKQN